MLRADRNEVGLLLGTLIGPAQLTGMARMGEALGFGELWVAEDFYYTAAMSTATAALGATARIPVGTGVVSAVTRHPALLAMEIATLAGMYPGRFIPGIGLGLPSWLREMGLYPAAQLAPVKECVNVVRRLLGGETVSFEGATFSCSDVALHYPQAVPIYIGAFGPKMLTLSGAIADGTIIGLITSTDYVRWARERIAEGALAHGRTGQHKVVVFVFFSIDANAERARAKVRGLMALYLQIIHAGGLHATTDISGITADLHAILEAGGVAALEREMPTAWLEDLSVTGTPAQCAERIEAYYAAGADSVILMPMPHETAEDAIRLAAREMFPLLRDRAGS
jgi:5,10-methylenetetrahydromethanopterin reductase